MFKTISPSTQLIISISSPNRVISNGSSSEISDVSAQNVILVGRPAAIDSYGGNELIDGFISYMPGYGYLSFYENGNNIALVVTGQETAGVRLVARVLARGEGAQANFMIVDRDYECKTHEISIDKVMNKAGKIAVSYKTKGTLGEVQDIPNNFN